MLLIRVGVGRSGPVPVPAPAPATPAGAASADKKAAPPAAPAAAAAAATAAPADKKKQQAAPAPGADKDDSSIDPSKLEVKVGLIVKCWDHPESEKLLCEEIDLGEESARQIASGLRPHYQAADMVGRKVLVLCNLKERSVGGFRSNGMVLCACSEDHSVVKLLQPPAAALVGERVVFGAFNSEPVTAAQMAKKKILEQVGPGLRTDSEGKAKWGSDAYFTLPSGHVTADALLADAPIS